MSNSDHFNQLIDQFETRDDSISEFANQLRELGLRVCSFEKIATNEMRPLTLRGLKIKEILDRAVRQNPGYQWTEVSAGVANLYPNCSILDSPVPNVKVFSKGAWRLLDEDLHIGKLGLQMYEEFGEPEGPPANLIIQNANLRAALNAIVMQLGRLVWHITGQPGSYYLNFTVVPLVTFSREGSIR